MAERLPGAATSGRQVTFRAVVVSEKKTATGIVVPETIVAELGAGKRPAVVVTINATSFRTTLGSMNGNTMIPVSAENRGVTGVVAGDEIDVTLAVDTAPRTVEVPAELAALLATEPAAKAFFDSLSPSQRKWFVTEIDGAKTPDTRAKRVEKSITLLRTGKAR
jgi:hypothetical protein